MWSRCSRTLLWILLWLLALLNIRFCWLLTTLSSWLLFRWSPRFFGSYCNLLFWFYSSFTSLHRRRRRLCWACLRSYLTLLTFRFLLLLYFFNFIISNFFTGLRFLLLGSMVWAHVFRSLGLRVWRLRKRLFRFWLRLARNRFFMVVVIILGWINVRAVLVFLVLRGYACSYRMLRLFCSSLGQNNYSATFSWHCCNLRRWSSRDRCFHSGLFWAWAFLGFLRVLWGNSWASALCWFALRSFLWYHSCCLFTDFGWSWSVWINGPWTLFWIWSETYLLR